MKAEITYIFHNCFILKIQSRAFIFDYPADRFLTREMKEMVFSEIKKNSLTVLSSHSHQDHFNPDIVEFLKYTPDTTFILSSDILEAGFKIKGLNIPNPVDDSLVVVEPENRYKVKDFTLQTFQSTDLGVAFLITFAGLKIYFGGDLANWNWDELEPDERSQMEESFRKTLEKLEKQQIHIAFVNADSRLSNWAGAAEFMERIKPELFVPMHSFGQTEKMAEFAKEAPQTGKDIFLYKKPGDKIMTLF